MKLSTLILSTLLVAIVALPASAANFNKKKAEAVPAKAAVSCAVTKPAAGAHFTTRDLNVVAAWSRSKNAKDVEKAPARKFIRDAVARNCKLPKDAVVSALPSALLQRMSQQPKGFSRPVVGRDILLVNLNTGDIVDIIKDAIN